MNTETAIPDGYMKDSAGRLVPESQIKEQDKLRDQTVTDLVVQAKTINQQLAEFKRRALNDVADLLQVAADKYDVTLGGKKGNVSLTTFDGRYKIQRTYAENIVFTEELEAAKTLFAEYLDQVTAGAGDDVRMLIDRAFRTNRNGNIKTAELLGLIKIEIQNPLWKTAIAALTDSIATAGTTVYVRAYERVGDSDSYRQIPLDLASV